MSAATARELVACGKSRSPLPVRLFAHQAVAHFRSLSCPQRTQRTQRTQRKQRKQRKQRMQRKHQHPKPRALSMAMVTLACVSALPLRPLRTKTVLHQQLEVFSVRATSAAIFCCWPLERSPTESAPTGLRCASFAPDNRQPTTQTVSRCATSARSLPNMPAPAAPGPPRSPTRRPCGCCRSAGRVPPLRRRSAR